MAFTIKLQDQNGTDLIDVTDYVRLPDGQGFNPTPAFEDGQFLDAPLAEGQPFMGINDKNAEIVVPMWVDAANKDTLTGLIVTMNKACQQARRVFQQDQGSSNPSYRDVTWAKFEPAYSYWPAAKSWLAGTLTIYCAPPYAHTGTARVLATVVNGSVANPLAIATIPAGSVLGDVPALMQVTVKQSTGPVGPGGRITGVAGVPSGWEPWIPAASLFSRHAQATMQAMATMPGSQFLSTATRALASTAQIARFALSATPYAGRVRVFGVADPISQLGVTMYVSDEAGNVSAPTSVVNGIDGVQLQDLGVVSIPTFQATSVFSLGAVVPNLLFDDSGQKNDAILRTSRALAANEVLARIAGLIVLPEDTTTIAVEGPETIAGGWLGGSGIASKSLYDAVDDYGNTFYRSVSVPTTSQYVGTFGLSHPTLGVSPLMQLPRDLQDFRARWVTHFLITNPTAVQGQNMFFQAGDEGFQSVAKLNFNWPVGGSQGSFSLTTFLNGSNVILGSQAIASHSSIFNTNMTWLLEVVRQGDQAYANFRYGGLSGNSGRVCLATGAAASVATYFVMVASVGGVATGLRANRMTTIYSSHYPSAPLLGFWVDDLSNVGRTVASDTYVLDGGAVGPAYRSPGPNASGAMTLEDKLRGAQLQLDPSKVSKVVGFSYSRDGEAYISGAVDVLAVDVRVKERFRFLR